jgi:hypothetical protein
MPVLGEEALGVELHADNGQFPVADGHDFLLAAGGFSPSRNDEVGVQCIGPDDEAVIARGGQWIGEALENPLVVVVDLVGLAVHQPFGPHDDAARRLANGLMAEADAEERDLAHEFLDALDGDAGFGRCAGAGGDDQMAWFLSSNLVRGDLVVPVNFDLQTIVDLPQPLDKVVGEGVVVIDEQNHGRETTGRTNGFASFYRSRRLFPIPPDFA